MKRITNAAALLLCVCAIAVAATPRPAKADTVLYQFGALRGPVATCQWFDDNINDRSLDAIIRQTDLIYNRTALTPDATVTNVQIANLQNGTQVAGFLENGVELCSGDDAINPSAPPATSPPFPST